MGKSERGRLATCPLTWLLTTLLKHMHADDHVAVTTPYHTIPYHFIPYHATSVAAA